jgi:hypothetical protein
MSRIIGRLVMGAVACLMHDMTSAALIFSQYVETNSGSNPKGIEVWNSGSSAVDFSTQNLQIGQGTNGGALSLLSGTLVNTGSLGAGDVLVIGTPDIGSYLTNQGLGDVRYISFGFSFNGDDSLGLYLGGNLVDVFGDPGNDPGTAWSGNGVSTANQNIALREGITTGDIAGWTDPSIRFETLSTTPASLPGGLVDFGIAPVPEPSLLGLSGLAVAIALRQLRRR